MNPSYLSSDLGIINFFFASKIIALLLSVTTSSPAAPTAFGKAPLVLAFR